MAHTPRPALKRVHPVLVTMRLADALPSLRTEPAWRTIVRCLCRGMRGLATRFAKQLNKLWKRRGTVFPDRYHARALTTPREVRNALAYVLLNDAHHEHQAMQRRAPAGAPPVRPAARIDPRSSGARFTGWREPVGPRDTTTDLGTVPARTWLLRVGWKRHGLLGLDEIPGVGPPVGPRRRKIAESR